MNVRDSQVIQGLLRAQGYVLTDNPQSADIILFNTCSVRQRAEERVWSELGRFRRTSDGGWVIKSSDHTPYALRHKPVIGVIGCMAQNYKDEIFKKAPHVDIVCGPSEIGNIALYLQEAIRSKKLITAVTHKRRQEKIYHTGFHETSDHAYVVISEGCDNYCSYCVVPYVRGRLRHRSAASVLKEIKIAIQNGIHNITLLGQNVNSYVHGPVTGKKQVDFVSLLKKISTVEGIHSLGFLTCHPKDTTRRLFDFMGRNPLVKKSLHMPFQSGSNRILQKMKRGYTVKKYLALVDDYRAIVYNGQLSTDVIVGFPGEREEDFQATRRLMEKVRFDMAFIFKYSPRPHTRAALLEDDVPQAVKERRNNELLNLQRTISHEKKKETV
jgi:tRNA-2-methylthio-N6-dimethylallyladenosine synthase